MWVINPKCVTYSIGLTMLVIITHSIIVWGFPALLMPLFSTTDTSILVYRGCFYYVLLLSFKIFGIIAHEEQ